jgi:hypothetical protein
LGYNYKVEFKKGRENKVADALSRAPHSEELMAISMVVPAWIEQVTSTYDQDEKCKELITKLSIDNASVQHYSLQNGILRYKGRVCIGDNGPHKKQLLENFHKSAWGGHSGERATYRRLSDPDTWDCARGVLF